VRGRGRRSDGGVRGWFDPASGDRFNSAVDLTFLVRQIHRDEEIEQADALVAALFPDHTRWRAEHPPIRARMLTY
jgi:hypothetical protein